MTSNFDGSSGARVMAARLLSGSEECMLCSRSGRRNARTNVVRSETSGDDKISTGIEGMYLKLGKRNAEATEVSLAVGRREVFVIIILLKG